MKVYPTEKIRNIALVSHSGAGKTTFIERVLFETGVLTRMGSVAAGNTAMDFEPEEIDRKSSTTTALAPVEFRDGKLNFFDTPGYIDFIGEVNCALHVADSAVVFIEASSGVEVGTEIVYDAAKRHDMPIMFVVNKMDRDNVRTARVLNSITDNLLTTRRLVKLQLPIGEGATFKGIVDLVTERAYIGDSTTPSDVPADMRAAVEEARVELIEAAAEGDDTLMEKYFEEFTLDADEIIRGLQGAMQRKLVIPIAFCAGERGIGTNLVLRIMQRLLPSPDVARPFRAITANDDEVLFPVSDSSPLAAFVFKTREDKYGKTSYLRVFGGCLQSDTRAWDGKNQSEIRMGSLSVVRGKEFINIGALHAGDVGAAVKLGDIHTNGTLTSREKPIEIVPIQQPAPIFSVAIHPRSQADLAKLSEALHRLQEEDPTLQVSHEAATNETILSGMGDLHLDQAVRKLNSKFGVHVDTTTPKIPYRETITASGSAEYTHKKQTGGAGQYARVNLRVESIGDDADFEFAQEIFGGVISGPFVVATEKGCRQAVQNGPVAGYPVKGVKAVVFDGKMHPVDSKEIAFQIAGREAFRKAMMQAGPALLEPLYQVIVTVPSDNMGDIMSDLNTRRAAVQGMEQIGPRAIVKAEVPLAEMQRYLMDLRSMTQGRGVYSMEFTRYGRVPSHLTQKVMAEAQHRHEEEA